MKCVLDFGKFSPTQADGEHIHRLLILDRDQLHVLVLVNGYLLDEAAPWYTESLSKSMQKLLREKIIESNYPKSENESDEPLRPHQKCMWIHDSATLRSVKELADTPLYILVENAHSDGILVETAVALYAPPFLRDLLDKSRQSKPTLFEIKGAGGSGEILKELTRLLGSTFSALNSHRLVVVTDSDGEYPQHIGKKALEISTYCKSKNIPCLVLSKRSAENYIPKSCWEKFVAPANKKEFREAVDVLTRLTNEQWDHLPMTGKGTLFTTSTPEIQRLYFEGETTISMKDVEILKRAELKGKPQKWDDPPEKGTLRLALLRQYPPTQADMNKRDHRGDLRKLVEYIAREI